MQNGRAEHIFYLVGCRVEFLIGNREGLHLAAFVACYDDAYFEVKIYKGFEHARSIGNVLNIFFAAANHYAKTIISSCGCFPYKGNGPALLGSFKTGSSSHHLKA